MSDVNEARRDRYAPFIGSLRLTSVPIHLSRLHASVRLMSCSAPYVHLTSPLRHEPSTLLTLSPFVCRVFRLSRSVASGMSGVEHVEAEHK